MIAKSLLGEVLSSFVCLLLGFFVCVGGWGVRGGGVGQGVGQGVGRGGGGGCGGFIINKK